MAEPKKPETLNVKPSHIKMESTGHVTITDPKVAELLQRAAGVSKGSQLKDDGVSVGVVVSKSF
jgi:hypothetical protein